MASNPLPSLRAALEPLGNMYMSSSLRTQGWNGFSLSLASLSSSTKSIAAPLLPAVGPISLSNMAQAISSAPQQFAQLLQSIWITCCAFPANSAAQFSLAGSANTLAWLAANTASIIVAFYIFWHILEPRVSKMRSVEDFFYS
ncbi:hypothetical protein CBOM_02131 [Ceraceosorus bombacis]|uniref:Uncharacterized protein n=1 Tax=Ceraceosorus bombacis TaxID=401625 RepID=A0A0P1BEG9_9BASI|nr:hypothetical protein CBOM_02131 [Ceraceosorus bombacis]